MLWPSAKFLSNHIDEVLTMQFFNKGEKSCVVSNPLKQVDLK